MRFYVKRLLSAYVAKEFSTGDNKFLRPQAQNLTMESKYMNPLELIDIEQQAMDRNLRLIL